MASSRSLNPQGKRSGHRRAGGRTAGKKSLDSPNLRQRLVIENVRPDVDGGRFLSKGVVGETISVEADIYSHGHDELAADLLYRHESESEWHRAPMQLVVMDEDRWRCEFNPDERGVYLFTIEAWIDPFARWRRDFVLKGDAGDASDLDLQMGALLLNQVAERASGPGRRALANAAEKLQLDSADATNIALDQGLAREARDWKDPLLVARYERELSVLIEGKKAAFSAWYEMFPRSASPDPGRPGTFRDVEARLDYVAGMGFDVLYLPPIHPIGVAYRKGQNSSLNASAGDPGCPWAIGSKVGGHKSINPDLGTMADFRRLVNAAKGRGLNIALDIAFQCSPDHPYVTEHPEWFRKRPDGSIQYAENPPKKYQDVYPFDFETEARESLWEELKSIFLFWIEEGVSFFRVDNPHTKPFAFWEWCIAEIRKVDPDVVLLAEAFTRKPVMYRLSKVGFTQSYTNFAWTRDKPTLTEYFTELSTSPVMDFFRPNAWPTTPDILTEQMRRGERATFVSRLVLAATLSASYGIYGPGYELIEHAALDPDSEEFLNSEKFEIRHWNLDDPRSLRGEIAAINRARHENVALQSSRGLRFLDIDNDQIIAYSKTSPDKGNVIVCVVNLDPKRVQEGTVRLPITDWGLSKGAKFRVYDLLNDAAYQWQGQSNFVRLDPKVTTAHIFKVDLAEVVRRSASG